jgi:molybdate/tungstate transport system ATP-binding protein
VIAVEGLSVQAGAFAVEGVSFTVGTGEYAVLMGRTGCGKTTLLEAVCGLKPVRGGRVRLLGRDVTHLPPADRGVGYVPQDLALFPTMTVREHLGFALEVRRWDRAEAARRVDELTELLGLGKLLDRRPRGLSGGEAQRVALGRALAFRPGVLLLDEPLSALDEDTRGAMYGLLRSVQRQTGVTALHVTHSRAEARALADRVFVFDGGAPREAPPNSLRDEPPRTVEAGTDDSPERV